MGLPPMRIAVNLSARRFQQNLAKTIARVLAETGLEPRYLEIEITEHLPCMIEIILFLSFSCRKWTSNCHG